MSVYEKKKDLQYWPPALCEYLLGAYEYDKETGFVLKRSFNARGVKNVDPIGYKSPQGDILYSLIFEERRYLLRVVKVAYFLATGKQYHKFAFKDENRENFKLDNIVPLGKEMTTGERASSVDSSKEQEEWIKEQRRKAQEIVDSRRTLYDKQLNDRRLAREQDKLASNPELAAKRAEKQRRYEEEVKRKEGVDKFLKDNPTGEVDWTPTLEREKRIQDDYLASKCYRIRERVRMMARGAYMQWRKLHPLQQAIYTGAPREVWAAFVPHAKAYLEFVDYDDFFKCLPSQDLQEVEKVVELLEWNCINAIIWDFQLFKDYILKDSVVHFMKTYKYRGQDVPKPTLPEDYKQSLYKAVANPANLPEMLTGIELTEDSVRLATALEQVSPDMISEQELDHLIQSCA